MWVSMFGLCAVVAPGEGDSQLTAAEAFHAAGLGSLLSELLHYSFLACEPQVCIHQGCIIKFNVKRACNESV